MSSFTDRMLDEGFSDPERFLGYLENEAFSDIENNSDNEYEDWEAIREYEKSQKRFHLFVSNVPILSVNSTIDQIEKLLLILKIKQWIEDKLFTARPINILFNGLIDNLTYLEGANFQLSAAEIEEHECIKQENEYMNRNNF